MKALYLLLFALILSLYNSQTCGGYAEKPEDCTDNHFYQSYCCYIRFEQSYKGSTHDDRYCSLLSKTQYDNIKEYVDYYKKRVYAEGWEADTYKINCDSKYICYSLFLLFLFLF